MKRTVGILLILTTLISVFAINLSAEATVVSMEGRLPFTDVKKSDWFADEVELCYINQIISGMDEDSFVPGDKLTRAQFVTMLANVEGVDTSVYEVDCFTDVKPSHWYYGAVAWAYNSGIVSGITETEFAPNRAIDRMSLSRMLCLYMKSKNYEVSISDTVLDRYTDADTIPDWALEGIKYLISAGLMSGMTETTVAPRVSVTRAQAARFLTVYTTDYRYGDCVHDFSEADCINPSACFKCGFALTLPLGHICEKLNCVTGDSCQRCGADVPPQPVSHYIIEATCTVAEHCGRCGVVTGPMVPHRFAGSSYCHMCHQYIYKSPLHEVMECVYRSSHKDGKGNGTLSAEFEYLNGDMGLGGIYYEGASGSFTFTHIRYIAADGTYIMTEILVPKVSNTYRYNTYYIKGEEVVCSGYGYIDPAKVKYNTTFSLYSYTGAASQKAWFEQQSSYGIIDTADAVDALISSVSTQGIDVFGFKYIKY